MLRRTARRAFTPDSPLHLTKIPGRKSLDDVCKLSLLEAADPPTITAIWTNHHKQYIHYGGRVIPAAAYDAIRTRLEKSPYFVVPVFRDKGLFNVVTNFNRDLVGVVPLGEWQKRQDHTQIHMTIQFFTELARTKGLVLVRTEIQDKVFVRQDCTFVMQMLLKYYSNPGLYEAYVEVFNKRPHAFDFHAFLRHMKDEAGKDNIKIEDKKTDYSAGDIKVPTPGVAAAIKKANDVKSHEA